MSKVVMYRRISVTRADSESLEAQRERILAWAAREGHEVIGDLCDDGVSGKSMVDRPNAMAALDMACRHRGSVLAVASLSRLGRSVLDLSSACARLTQAGCSFVSVSEAFDVATPGGRLLMAVLGASAQFERETLVDRTRQAMHHLRRHHRLISRHVPYGWDVAPDGKTLTVNPSEDRIIVEMKRLHDAGLSYNAVARELNAHGHRAKLGGAWNGRAVRLTLQRLAKLNDVAA